MQSTPWTAYTARMMIKDVAVVATILLILFSITLISVGGFYFLRMIREYFRSKPFVAFEKKAAAAIQAADMGRVAIVCGPILGFAIAVPGLLLFLFVGPDRDFHSPPLFLLFVVGVGAVAGAITAGAFWISSALLGNVRKAAKRLRGVRDPEFDGPV
jgi:hypothetical protein